MRIILDQGIGRSTVKYLSAAGHVAEHVGDLGLAQAPDSEILEVARAKQAIVITLDADFHKELAVSRASNPSVIRIRIEGLKSTEMARLLVEVMAKFDNELLKGAVVSVTPSSIRAKMLPIGG